MIDRQHELSITKQAEALGISRSSVYYLPRAVPAAELAIMRRMDELHLEFPFAGSRMLRDLLNQDGIEIGRRRVTTLMKRIGIEAIYRKPNTSKPAPGHKIYPYLLRGMVVDTPDKVWAMDITYVPMARGFVYLAAVVDWFSRRVLSWRLSITMEAGFCIEALEEALARHGRPEIFNTDQGSQFTIHRRAEGPRHQDQHGRQGPVHGQHLRRAAVEKLEIRRRILACLHFGRRSQGRHCRLAALLQRGTPSSGARLPDAPADLRSAMPVDRIGCAERFRFPRFPSKIGKRGNAHRRPHAHRHQQQGFGN
jgi:transposase-like protein